LFVKERAPVNKFYLLRGVVGNFLSNLFTHRNYEDGSSKSQKNQHKHRDLREKPQKEKTTERERSHYNNGDNNSVSLMC